MPQQISTTLPTFLASWAQQPSAAIPPKPGRYCRYRQNVHCQCDMSDGRRPSPPELPHPLPPLPRVDITLLNAKQALCHNKFRRHCQRSLQAGPNNPLPPFLLNLDGTAGTGKTFTVNAICQTAADLVDEAGMGSMVIVRRLAPTGIAAFHIHGSTYHSALGISPKEKKGKAAAGRQLAALQEDWKHIRYLIIDGKSTVGRVGLALIDKRLREIFPHRDLPTVRGEEKV